MSQLKQSCMFEGVWYENVSAEGYTVLDHINRKGVSNPSRVGPDERAKMAGLIKRAVESGDIIKVDKPWLHQTDAAS